MTATAKETEKAKAAYQIYEGMGTARTLEKTAEIYRQQNLVKTSSKLKSTVRVLADWSVQWNWQARVAAYEEKFRAKQQTAAEKARMENLTLVRELKGKALACLRLDAKGNPLGKFATSSTVGDLDKLVKLEMALLGDPLADKHEVSGALTVTVVQFGEDDHGGGCDPNPAGD